MSSHENEPTPPEGLPDEVAAELPQLTPDELRNTIIYAQELLQSTTSGYSVEPGPDEEMLRATIRYGHTEVLKRDDLC